jgi:hypothetical protein
MCAQTGRRAVWHIVNGVGIPEGYRVYGICECLQCLNPAHAKCGPVAQWGAHMKKTGYYQGSIPRQLASRAGGKRRSALTEGSLQVIRNSDAPGRQLARELGVSEQIVSKARNGHLRCFQPIGSPFAGLF